MDVWVWAAAWVAALSLLDFGLCAWDKVRARRGGARVPEARLLGIAALGGSPGLVLAMGLVRHKTRKASFLLPLVVIVVLQAAMASWLLTR